jgi:hypothetical protein
LRIRRPIGVENRRRIYRFVEDSRRQWGVEDAALSPRDFFNGLLAEAGNEIRKVTRNQPTEDRP